MSQLTLDQYALVEKARRFTWEHLVPLEQTLTQQEGIEPEQARTLMRLGQESRLFATNIDSKYGGVGLSTFENVLVQEQLGATKDVLIRRATGNIYECLTLGTAVQQERYLFPALKGERWCSLAVSEPEAGSDAASIKTCATKNDRGWVLNGRKMYISDAEYSDYFIVAAKTAPELGAKGISLFLVDKNMPGFSLGRRFNMMGFVGTSHNELILDQIHLNEDALLGEVNQGFQMLHQTLGKARLAKVSARGLGKCVRLLDLMMEHAKQRHQFGKPIVETGNIQYILADCAIEIRAARALLWETAKRMDSGESCREEISMLKVFVSELVGRVADHAVQIFGASGCHDGHLIESFYRDARLFRIIDGTSEVHRNIIANSLIKQGTPAVVDI
ncbi:acyl-CoA dehydrogenase family protein [Xenorhabdus littoralis]|uniref:acyl-CoA dehydrogenase family protein n=1 Tax=Xenorhabdus littoralis TaxID=2582835 RepID=UPI0029E80495|nr:acyl-CoA dehydrogenase family protein [Xenorhabdus sp. psl]MDX7991007.1 acyl-CoA dehydrogenase [Xenorhabdus sp. psl]